MRGSIICSLTFSVIQQFSLELLNTLIQREFLPNQTRSHHIKRFRALYMLGGGGSQIRVQAQDTQIKEINKVNRISRPDKYPIHMSLPCFLLDTVLLLITIT
ncbi:hypothetical protein OIU84_011877 [Salix udensis]|uniref:Uncharacterized protein n=1 Tax=Salix udensis TaxID=889485 RepID=A0AAD6JR01_9ROSI|nr:hypothetical protein OIU84_011877 [Salix udensis]